MSGLSDVGGPRQPPAPADVVGVVAHDLRHLVGAVLHQVEVLSTPEVSEDLRRRSLGSLARTAEELGRFADSLADLERVQRQEFQAQRAPVDVSEVVEASIRDRVAPDDEPMVVQRPRRPAMADTDERLLRRALVTLLALADAAADVVTVEVVEGPNAIEVVVSGGNPLDPAPGGRRPPRISDGLGPWVGAALCQLAGAELEVESPRNGPQRYCVSLPLPPAIDRTVDPGDAHRMVGEQGA